MNELVHLHTYPDGVIPITGYIEGTAFFPGGSGLYLERTHSPEVKFPIGGVMVLGHNFDSKAGFERSMCRGEEDLESPTWRNLRRLLEVTLIPPKSCFFTNAFMGLCAGSRNGKYQGRDDDDFRRGCQSFLKAQIQIQQPRFILTLGLHVPPLLASTALNLTPWEGRPKRLSCDRKLTLKDLNAAPMFDAEFELEDGGFHTAVAIAVAHPCRPMNGINRMIERFANEVELIRAGWEHSLLLPNSPLIGGGR